MKTYYTGPLSFFKIPIVAFDYEHTTTLQITFDKFYNGKGYKFSAVTLHLVCSATLYSTDYRKLQFRVVMPTQCYTRCLFALH